MKRRLVFFLLTDYEKLSGKKITKFNEAPMLAELVKQGKLPPVQERLPKNPVVVVPFEEIGQYGGTWRRVWFGLSDQWGPNKICFEYPLLPNKNGAEVLPNLFEDMQVSTDGRVYTFKIREGLRWSDGTPVTTEDVRFWYELVHLQSDVQRTLSVVPAVSHLVCTPRYRHRFHVTLPLHQAIPSQVRG